MSNANLQLYLTSFGSYLHVKDALFELRTKNLAGSYDKRHFAARKVRSIVFTTNGALSTQAVKLALTHNVDIVFSERSGQPLGRVWHTKLGSTTRIRKQQLRASVGRPALRYTLTWLSKKLEQQSIQLNVLQKHRKRRREMIEESRKRIDRLRESVLALKDSPTLGAVADTLRGLEGTAGRLYFQTLSLLLPEPYRFAGRSMRPAADAFNAFLNYAYGILYGRVEKALIIAGLDPYVGFLHRDDYDQKSMVFDFIEPYRIHADHVVFRLFSRKKVNRDHWQELHGGVGLTKSGKELLIAKFNEYLDEGRVRHRGRNLTRGHVLQLEAHRLANELLGLDLTDVIIEEV